LCGPFGPALAAAVFSELVMGLGGQDMGLRSTVEAVFGSPVGLALLAAHTVAAGVAVGGGQRRARYAALAVPLWASTAAAVAGGFELVSLPASYAWEGEGSAEALAAQRAAGVCMITGFFGLASLRVWRRELEAAPEPRAWSPEDTRGYLVAGALSALVGVGLVFRAWAAVPAP
jgi:hypothetical protein